MRNYITLNGKNSNEINGLLIQELPPISKPQIRTQIEEIDGRDGDIVTPLGFAAYDKEISVGLYKDFDINEIIGYFNSKGTIVFSNEPDKYYNYQIIDQIDFERLVRYRTATVKMHCQPFKYSTTEGTLVEDENVLQMNNTTFTSNGIASTAKNGTITATGTATGTYANLTNRYAKNLPAGEYTFSIDKAIDGEIRLRMATEGDADAYTAAIPTGSTSVGITTTETAINSYVYLSTTKGKSYNFTITPKLVPVNGPIVSGEDTALVLENTGEAPFNKLEPKGNTQQDTLSGKNLLDYVTTFKSGTYNGITATLNNDGSITVSGKPTGDYVKIVPYIDITNLLEDGQEYSLSSSAGEKNLFLQIRRKNASGTFVYSDTYSGNKTLTIDKTTYPKWEVGVMTHTVANWGDQTKTYTSNFQFEKGSVTDFEPYCGGVPSPNPDYPQAVKVVTGENVVKITGKNIFDYVTTFKSGTYNGITATLNNDGSITISGKPTANHVAMVPIHDITDLLEDGATYALSASGHDNKFIAQLQRRPLDGGSTQYLDTMSGNKTITINKSANKYYAGIITVTMANWGDNPLTITRTFQLEKGSVTDFEPYQEQSYIIDLNNNLYNKNSAFKSGSDIRLSVTLEPNTTYIFDTGRTWTGARLYNSSNTMTRKIGNNSSSDKSVEFTTTESEVRAELTFYGGPSVDVATYDYSGVEFYIKGSEIELCKIGTYQDRIYKDGSKWYIEKQITKQRVDNRGSMVLEENGVRYRNVPYDIPASAYPPLLSNYLQSASSYDEAVNTNGDSPNRIGFNASGILLCNIGGYTTTEEYINFFNNHEVYVYYALATPVDEEITNEALIAQLEALDQAHSYKGRTHLNAIATGDNMPHILSVEASQDSESTIVNSGNIISRPKITIYGSGNIGMYINDIQILQIALGDEGYITIDSDQMEAYKDTVENLKNRLVTGDYSKLALQPGENKIYFSGSVTKYEISGYSRWL